MDFALAQLALVFLPGIIWATIDAKYGAGLKPTQSTLLIRSFVFGMTTYSCLFVIYVLFGQPFGYPELASNVEKLNFFELKDEIALSIPLSFVMCVGWLWVVRKRYLKRFLHFINVTRRYGDEDLWSYTLNSDDANVEYVHLRDTENGFTFCGWVNAYSESEENRELLLSDVIVYNEQGLELSKAPVLYLARPKNNIWLEFPYKKEGYDNV